ncbi:SpoIIE family protein phosphatase [Bacillus sp. 31A1R]|uniref:SpoIIE family protein phosphatase n=1 Tax=Robertmurraya mangrovi TaxID=3098077 RepID=A0ABU5J4G8_9BACI|nr:SpoIIE family protein phosphatase [Bacillus sp. 31A1R]MDZ5474297.1 SpoIIE family protein phosphatase [Bacillus sp. 31A1R]
MKKQIEELKSAIKHFQSLFESLDEVYWTMDVEEGKLLQISPSCQKIYGLPPEAFFENSAIWLDVVYPEDYEYVLEKQQVLKTGEKLDYEYRIIHQQDQSIRWVRDQTVPTLDSEGNIIFLNGMISDITEKKMKDKRLVTLAKVLNSTIEGVLVTDHNQKIIMFNPAFTTITGYGSEVIGMTPKVLRSGLQESNFYKKLWHQLKTKGFWQGELSNRRKNGDIYVQWATITTIKGENGEIQGYASIFDDITERKREEDRIHEDIQLASLVQKTILKPSFNNNDIQISGYYKPSYGLAGDMYTWYELGPGKYGVIIFDVMGHGVAASLVVMSINSILRSIIQTNPHPTYVFKELNKHIRNLFHLNKKEVPFYFTGIYSVIDLGKNQIEYSNAGHPAGFLRQVDGNIQRLDEGTVPIGLLDEIDVPTQKLSWTKGSQLILYTDGLIDIFNESILKNIVILEKEINKQAKLFTEKDIENFIDFIQNKYGEFKDDVSLLLVNFK